MELTHRFTVPATAAETWAAFNNVEEVAGCFPGATVTEVDGDEFTGSCKVKLGPIALVYNGSGKFVEKDEQAGRLVLEAKGKDRRGNGTAGATVTAALTEVDDGTAVEVLTDLSITGKPAQFGRGVIQDVSDKLLGQFVDCLEARLRAPGPASVEESPASASPTSVIETPGSEATRDAVPPSTAEPTAQTAAPPASTAPASPRPPEEPRQADALDLGATALPILLKAYWKQLAALGGTLLVLLVLVLRRRSPRP